MQNHKTLAVSATLLLSAVAGLAQAEVITVRSGQVGGLPGSPGQPDDTVRFLANNPVAAPISASPFGFADFLGASTGAPAVVINPHPAWIPSLPSDPAARWINHTADIQQNADGTVSGSGLGPPGSCLFAVPFFVTTPGATGGYLTLTYAVDDVGGDQSYGGGNPDFLYINGTPTGYSGGNFGAPTTLSTFFIPFSQGWNTLYMYQRDVGAAVSGTIFSMSIEVVPAPSAAAVLGLGGLAAARRRRRA
jgi:hypothetical protein